MRKCSDEISTESTVLSAVPQSPATQLKTANNTTLSCSGGTTVKGKTAEQGCKL